MNVDKYYWTNRASIHHIERLKDFLPANSNAEEILRSGIPRYIEHIEDSIISEDHHRRYDLLIEYYIYHPSHGIYFGCRETTLHGFDHQVETKATLEEWNNVLPLALRRLNNVFPEKDFSCRLRDTDNDNDRTFWPFWISLHEDESPDAVARVALRLIAEAYLDFIKFATNVSKHAPHASQSVLYLIPEPKAISYPPIRTAFTQEAYDSFFTRLSANVAVISDLQHKDTNIEQVISIVEIVLRRAEGEGYIQRSPAYACAWTLREGISDIEFSTMIKILFELMGKQLNLKGSIKIPWKDLIRLFLRHDESPFKEQLKTLRPQTDTLTTLRTIAHSLLPQINS